MVATIRRGRFTLTTRTSARSARWWTAKVICCPVDAAAIVPSISGRFAAPFFVHASSGCCRTCRTIKPTRSRQTLPWSAMVSPDEVRVRDFVGQAIRDCWACAITRRAETMFSADSAAFDLGTHRLPVRRVGTPRLQPVADDHSVRRLRPRAGCQDCRRVGALPIPRCRTPSIGLGFGCTFDRSRPRGAPMTGGRDSRCGSGLSRRTSRD